MQKQAAAAPKLILHYGVVTYPSPKPVLLSEQDKDGNRLVAGDHIRKSIDHELPNGWGIIPYYHDGLYLGDGKVIHYSGNAGPESTGKVEVAPIEQFGEWWEIKVVTHSDRKFSRTESIKRARSRLHEDRYSLLFNNCQHFVNWCIDGKHVSEQVAIASIVPTLALGQGSTIATLARALGINVAGLTGLYALWHGL